MKIGRAIVRKHPDGRVEWLTGSADSIRVLRTPVDKLPWHLCADHAWVFQGELDSELLNYIFEVHSRGNADVRIVEVKAELPWHCEVRYNPVPVPRGFTRR